MSARKKNRASKPKRRSVQKTGLVALAAAAMASPVASAPVLAQSQTQVSPQPSPTDLGIDEKMGIQPHPFTFAPGDALQPTPKRDQLQTEVLKATPKPDPLQTTPAAPSTRDKALIYTGPSKPSRLARGRPAAIW